MHITLFVSASQVSIKKVETKKKTYEYSQQKNKTKKICNQYFTFNNLIKNNH